MNPTYISTVILKPGARYAFSESVSSLETLSLDSPLGGVYYSVTHDKIVADGEELLDAEGKLAETLFMVTSIQEVGPSAGNQGPWLVDHMANGGYEDLDGNMKAMYEVALSLVPKEEDSLIIPISFLGDWTIETSWEPEGGYTEVDAIDFAGPCKVVPV